MKTEALERLAFKMYKVHQALATAAKTDPQLEPLRALTNELWSRAHKVARARQLVTAARQDKGEVLWTVFSPIILVSGSLRYRGGVRETVRTSHRKSVAFHWKDSARREREWEPARPDLVDSDFCVVMAKEAA